MAVLAPVNDYTEVTFIFDDGSKHVTASCLSCAKKLTLETAEDVYAADLLRFDDEAWPVNWDHLLNRKITQILVG